MRVHEGRGSSEGDGNAIDGGCLKVYLKDNRKILSVDCTLASARPNKHTIHTVIMTIIQNALVLCVWSI